MFDQNFFEPELLRALVVIAETRSFTRAAEQLHLTQPTISTQVRRLEEYCGRMLFKRSKRAVRLTSDGEAMLGYARAILQITDQARRHFAQPPLEGSVRFGVVEDFAATGLASVLGRLRRQHPNFELTTEVGLSMDMLRSLETGSLDLILSKRVCGRSQGHLLGRQKLVWVGSTEVLGGPQDTVPLALYPAPSASREIMLQALRQHGRRWSVRFESRSLSNLRAAVLAGLGISAFGYGMIPSDLTPLPLSVDLPELRDVEFVLDQRPDCADPVVSAFGSILRSVVPMILLHPRRRTSYLKSNQRGPGELASLSNPLGCIAHKS
jgi:DNA-binding transcriptional LysR family regulator